jgi:outer membrane protein TolC
VSIEVVSGGLTAEQAGQRAAVASHQVSAKRAQVNAAEAAIDETFYSSAPRLTLTARYTRVSPVTPPSLGGGGSLVGTTAPPGPLPAGAPLVGIDGSLFTFPVIENQYYLNAGLVVPLSEYLMTTSRVVRGARLVRESATLDQRATRVEEAANAKLAFYSWVQSKLGHRLAEENLSQAERQLQRAQALYAAGRLAEADVLQTRAFVAESELSVQRAESGMIVSEERLRLVIRAPANEPLQVGEDVLAPLADRAETASKEQLYREAVGQRLEIRRLEKTEYSLREGQAVQQSRAYPRLEAFGNLTYANPNQRVFPQAEQWDATWDVGAQLVWTLNDLGTGSAEARKIAAEREQIRAQRSVLEDAVRVEILSAKQALAEARASIATAEQGQQAAQAAFAARDQLHQHGRATSIELMQAETALFQARLNVIRAHIALRVARVQLDHALGRDAAEPH